MNTETLLRVYKAVTRKQQVKQQPKPVRTHYNAHTYG